MVTRKEVSRHIGVCVYANVDRVRGKAVMLCSFVWWICALLGYDDTAHTLYSEFDFFREKKALVRDFSRFTIASRPLA